MQGLLDREHCDNRKGSAAPNMPDRMGSAAPHMTPRPAGRQPKSLDDSTARLNFTASYREWQRDKAR
jgi:hypothetical protein